MFTDPRIRQRIGSFMFAVAVCAAVLAVNHLSAPDADASTARCPHGISTPCAGR